MTPRLETKNNNRNPSPKSVITDMRFVSPGSSSSSSAERRTISHSEKSPKSHAGRGRSYRPSDGEFGEPASSLDFTGTSRELDKNESFQFVVSLPKENLHPVMLEAANASDPTASKIGSSEPKCRIPFAPTVKSPRQIPLPAAITVLAERSGGNSSIHRSGPRSLVAPRNNPISRAKNQEAAKRQTRDAHTSERRFSQKPTTASERVAEDEVQVRQSSELSDSSTSSNRRYITVSEREARRRDPNSQPTFSGELSSNEKSLDRVDSAKTRSVGQGAAANFGYPGTPLRFFPGWQGNSETLPTNNTHSCPSTSPEVQKGTGYVSPASSTDAHMRLRSQHRFLSGPLMSSMIPKPPPSKWDDAEKWIVSPVHRESPAKFQHQPLQGLSAMAGRRHSITGAQTLRSHYGVSSVDHAAPLGKKSPQLNNAFLNAGKVDSGPKQTTTSLKKRTKALSFSDFSPRFDPSPKHSPVQAEKQEKSKRNAGGKKSKSVSEGAQLQPSINAKPAALNPKKTSPAQHAISREKRPIVKAQMVDMPSKDLQDTQPAKHSHTGAVKEVTTAPVAPDLVVNSNLASCTDMTTHSTWVAPASGLMVSDAAEDIRTRRQASSLGAIPRVVDALELQSFHTVKLELKKVTGDEQPALDRSLVWTTREEEDLQCAASLREDPEDMEKVKLATKATEWEEVEREKSTKRFKTKEAKIKAWEELQKAQADAEMKLTQTKAENILADATEKMKGRLAFIAKKAAEMRAAVEAARNQRSAKAAEREELMGKTSRLSPSPLTRSSLSAFRCCFGG